ncbi:MAG: hypothetical protein J6I79_03810 [Paludibacteraceae bacterium]|nr:hypothetical protein [Paludibacteraceae bacterium]MBR6041786.1 hypothetical protein [Paludibacteraceae bacterium]
MKSQLQVSYYKNRILSMKVSRLKGENNIAKPVLFLAILKGIEDGEILGNRVVLSDYLESKYKEIFLSFRATKITSIAYPYYYLNSEDFYYVKGNTTKKTPSIKFIKEEIEFAALDDELWDLLQDNEIRQIYAQAIISHFIK